MATCRKYEVARLQNPMLPAQLVEDFDLPTVLNPDRFLG
jgi:hypothetical protein